MDRSEQATYLTIDSEFAKSIPGFVARQSQIKMAALLDTIINDQCNGVIEAGTGTGKTFAYLLPAMNSGKKVIVSTGTKNLQDQLFYQDIPLVNRQLGLKAALLKGRSNYLCPDRLKKNLFTLNRQSSNQHSQHILSELVLISDWSIKSKTGDLTDLFDAGQNSAVMPLVTSTADNCLGRECEFIDRCPVYRARAIAKEADVLVVNHHLLFSDIASSEEKTGNILPDADLIIVDEAHQLPAIARQFLGERISSSQLLELTRDILREQIILGNDDPELINRAQVLAKTVGDLVKPCLASDAALTSLLSQPTIQGLLEDVDIALANLSHHLRQVGERTPGLASCYSRTIRLLDLFTLLTELHHHSGDYAHWIQRQTQSFTLFLSPLEVAKELAPIFAREDKTWIFVSATLTIANEFEHIKSSLGLCKPREGRFDSPFDYVQQVKLYVPPNLPRTGNDLHTKKLLESVLPLIRTTTGRTFYLFTSHRALRLTAELLKHEYDITFLVQGTMSKKRLLEKFSNLNRCVLLATYSFWEGVDVRGANLKCLVIDKLPFSSPDDPLAQAQRRAIDDRGGNSFRDLSLPEAAIALKQGFGRLIRQESDKGLFVLGDERINSRSYGKILRCSLPSMNSLNSEAEALDYLKQIEAFSP